MKIQNLVVTAVAVTAVVAVAAPVAAVAAPSTPSNPYANGVEMTVRNDTGAKISVCERGNALEQGVCKNGWRTNLKPGAQQTFIGKSTAFDDVEIAVFDERDKFVYEIDGSNPKMGYPSISILHRTSGDFQLKGFSVNESSHMSYDRVWAKRNSDGANSIKTFDVHVKRTT